MKLKPLSAQLGTEVEDLDASRPPDRETVQLLKDALASSGLLVLRGQSLPDEALQVAFSSAFGKTEVREMGRGEDRNTYARLHELSPRPTYSGQSRSCNYFVNGPGFWEKTDDGLLQGWHSDLSYLKYPLPYSFLYAIEAPDEGYETWYSNQLTAYEHLDEATREAIDQLEILHSWKSNHPDRRPAAHPLVLAHPRTGQRAIYGVPGFGDATPLSAPGQDGEQLIKRVSAHLEQEQFVYKHVWRTGDLLIWDNRCVLHRRGPQIDGQTRILRRTQADDSDATARSRLSFEVADACFWTARAVWRRSMSIWRNRRKPVAT